MKVFVFPDINISFYYSEVPLATAHPHALFNHKRLAFSFEELFQIFF